MYTLAVKFSVCGGVPPFHRGNLNQWNVLSSSIAAPALRTPLSIAGSYATPFAMMGHHDMNGSLTSPGVYPGLISPQMSAAAAAAYGRSPMVRISSSV